MFEMVHVGFSKKFDRKSWSIIDIFKEGASCWQKKICQILKWRSLCLISYTEILCGQNRRSWKFTWGHGGSRKVAIFYKNTLSNFFPRWRSRWSCDIDELIIFLFHGSKIKMQCYLSSEKNLKPILFPLQKRTHRENLGAGIFSGLVK